MNDHTGPAPVSNKRVLRTMHRLSLACALAGLAVIIGGFIVLSTSFFDEMSAGAHPVIPDGSVVMSDDEFIRSVLPVVCAAGIIHLAGVITGFVGRKHAEDRAELGRCALGVGVNAFFLAALASSLPRVLLATRLASLSSSLCVAVRSYSPVSPCLSASLAARARDPLGWESRACW